MRIFRFQEIDSTNRFLKDFEQKENYDCIIAHTQSAGVGRRGNPWVSNEGMGLFSFALNERYIKEEDYTRLPLITGLAVLKGLLDIECLDYKFKWTNDIYLDNKKLCGILVEKSGDWFVIGIGININNCDFGYVGNKAISLCKATGKKYDVESIIITIIEHFQDLIGNFNWEKMLEEINSYNYLKGREIEIVKDGKSIGRGIAGDIWDDGRLEVICKDGKRLFDIGEIHIKR